ncbi:helix-turn-helix transcriptional regulator [Mycolicibacterium brisbanense]|nr:AraC family transcriptional regulator [Mycolicibacterium brisbanense]MCV7161484.1 helix-turn-helix transcriptional regulator [Mycolicibacterium brisbanense]
MSRFDPPVVDSRREAATGSRAWFVATFATAPTIAHEAWATHAPHRIVVCPDLSELRRSRRRPAGPMCLTSADIWVIPVAQRSFAVGHGPMTEYCEMELPPRPFDATATEPLVQPRGSLTVQLLDRIHQLRRRRDAAARLFADALKNALRLHVIDLFTVQNPPGARPGRPLTQHDQTALLDYIDQHGMEDDLSIAALSERMGMTPSVFTRAFTAAFHATPHQFILDRRIARAKHLLCNTEQSITEISSAVGFSTHSHFTTAFKKRVGMTPAAYRTDGTNR